MTDSRTAEAGSAPLGGWLVVLCAWLAIGQPLNLAAAAVRALGAMALRGWPLGLLLVVRIGVTALGVAAAMAIVRRHGGALRLTHAALGSWMLVEIFVRTTSFFPNNRVPGDAPFYVAAIFLNYVGWTAYLMRSTRVKRVLGS